MKKLIISIVLFCSVLFPFQNVKANNNDYDRNMKQDLLCLMMAYPKDIKDLYKDSQGKIYIVMSSGKKIIYDDKKDKSSNEKFSNGDLQDMMQQIYPLNTYGKLLEKDNNPGRVRVYSLLDEVYGPSREKIEHNLKNTNANLQFNSQNGAREAFSNAIKEIVAASKSGKNIYSTVFPINGTYNYRLIAGTARLSPHSYGIAVDLKVDRKDYWKWASRESGQKRIDEYPKEVAQIFEKNNFIWGGKWGAFDIMHFEYRPEIIMKAKYFGDNNDKNKKWYEGNFSTDDYSKKCIEKIDNTVN